jgi:DNA-binding PadR family transcriptional regulator
MKRLLPVTTKAALLQALHRDGPGCGVDLIKRVKLFAGLKLCMGSVYPALVLLDDYGFIREKRGERVGRKIVYELTAKGKRASVAERLAVGKLFGLGGGGGSSLADGALAGML